MNEAEARESVRKMAQPCPCCGGAVMVALDASEETAPLVRALLAAGVRIALVRPEDAEAEIVARDFRPVDPIGGPTR